MEQPPPDPDVPHDDPDLEAALRDPAFDDAPADDPGRPEDFPHEPGVPHVGLEEDQLES